MSNGCFRNGKWIGPGGNSKEGEWKAISLGRWVLSLSGTYLRRRWTSPVDLSDATMWNDNKYKEPDGADFIHLGREEDMGNRRLQMLIAREGVARQSIGAYIAEHHSARDGYDANRLGRITIPNYGRLGRSALRRMFLMEDLSGGDTNLELNQFGVYQI